MCCLGAGSKALLELLVRGYKKAGAEVRGCQQVEGSRASLLLQVSWDHSNHTLAPQCYCSGLDSLASPGVEGAQCFVASHPIMLGSQGTGHYPVPTSASAMISMKLLLMPPPLPLQATTTVFSGHCCHVIPLLPCCKVLLQF